MKIYITYFYNVRFLEKWQIPVSTAMWDPRWYHNFQSQRNVFIDKRGIYNGLRYEKFHFNEDDAECIECNRTKNTPDKCSFIRKYSLMLENLDFEEVMNDLTLLSSKIKELEKFKEEPEIVLLVHEKPDTGCSERWPLINWFKKHGVEVEEYDTKRKN